MSIGLSNYFSCTTLPSSTTLPLWLASRQLFEWVEVPGSRMTDMDLQPLINAQLTDAAGSDIGFQSPVSSSAILYFGCSVREIGSTLLAFGGGGARAWAGNEVRKLSLESETPRWECHNDPAPSTEIYLNNYGNLPQQPIPAPTPDASTPYMKNLTPNARHPFHQAHFHNGLQRFYLFGCDCVWQTDSGIYQVVDSLDWATKVWSTPGTHANIPYPSLYNPRWQVKHPITEKVYCSNESRIMEYTPETNSWLTKFQTANTDLCRKFAAVDSLRNVILAVGLHSGTQNQPVIYDMNSWQLRLASFTGAEAGTVICSTYAGQALVFDPVNECFFYSRDDGFLYRIFWRTDSLLEVEKVATTGTAPQAGVGTYAGANQLWARMQYIPSLKGIAFLQSGRNQQTGTNPYTYFIRTAN